MSSEQPSSGGASPGRIVLILATFGLVGFVLLLKDSGSISFLGMSIPVGVVAIVGYLLGVAAGWGAMKRPRA